MSGELDFIGNIFGSIFGSNSRNQRRNNRNEYRDEQTRQRNKELQKNLNTQKKYIDSLSSNIKNMEKNHINTINNMKSNFNNKLKAQSSDIKNLRVELKNLSNEFSNVTSQLQSQIGALQDTEIKSLELANQWLSDTSKLLEFIEQNYRHDKFMPGQLNQLIQKVNTSVVSNINNGIYQAAVSSAQNIFLDAQQLRMELELKEAEWNILYENIEVDIKDFIDNCENSKNVEFEFNTSNGVEKFDVDVDYWSKGDISLLLKELNEIKDNFKKDKNNLSLENLEIMAKEINEYENKIETTVNKARNSVFSSQVRGDLAEVLASKFEQKGWVLKEAIYEKEDLRNPLHIKFGMGDDEIVIKYSPEESEDSIRNSINVSFFDRSRNDENYRQERLKEILETTQYLGVECSTPVCKAGTEDKSCQDETKLDFEKFKTKLSK